MWNGTIETNGTSAAIPVSACLSCFMLQGSSRIFYPCIAARFQPTFSGHGVWSRLGMYGNHDNHQPDPNNNFVQIVITPEIWCLSQGVVTWSMYLRYQHQSLVMVWLLFNFFWAFQCWSAVQCNRTSLIGPPPTSLMDTTGFQSELGKFPRLPNTFWLRPSPSFGMKRWQCLLY